MYGWRFLLGFAHSHASHFDRYAAQMNLSTENGHTKKIIADEGEKQSKWTNFIKGTN